MPFKEYIAKNIKDLRLKEFLLELDNSLNINERLLAHCIAIELQSSLTEERILIETFKVIDFKSVKLDFSTFTNQDNRKIHLSKLLVGNRIPYSRIVSKPTFRTRIGSMRYKSFRIDNDKIMQRGWPNGNGIIWVTPTVKINEVWEKSKSKKFPANDICDFLGFPRNEPDNEYVKIDYSPDFTGDLYQPNSSNRRWIYEYNLFLSNPYTDNYGLTYNENGVPFAKELVHEESSYVDDKFSAHNIGRSSTRFPIHDNIINEARKRLGL